jgi:hypothetical protein
MIGPTDLLHLSPTPHFETFQVFLISEKYGFGKTVKYKGYSQTGAPPKNSAFIIDIGE